MGPLTKAIPVVLVSTLAILSACAPQGPSRAPPGQGASGPGSGPAESSGAPKVLTVGIQDELKGFVAELSLENVRVGGVRQPKPMVHNLLTVENHREEWLPELAAEQISVERGTWRVNPDGSMDTTWKIRPNVKWHDGAPFTSEDLLFAWRVFTDPEVPSAVGPASRLIVAATAPDPLTLEVHWSTIFVDANQAPGLVPLARHVLEPTYLADKAGLGNSPFLSTEFIGLGPYKLARWEPGAYLELARFDDYWRGRPPLDRVVVQFMGDANTMVANILAEAVDVVLPPAVDLESALDVKQRWEGSGHQVLVGTRQSMRILDPQQRPDLARPRNGFIQRAVRQAFYHAMDRQTLADVLTSGMAPVADSWFAPGDPVRREVEPLIPKYPYDLARAQQLLAEAGWSRGADGVLVHQPSGERFEVEINGTTQPRVEREQNIIADGWKKAGAHVTLALVPRPMARNVEYRSTRPGGTILARGVDAFRSTYPHSKYIPGPENNWTGNTYGGYRNAKVDELLDRMVVTIAPLERLAIEKDLLQAVMGEVAVWPLYWDVTQVLALRSVKGIASGNGDYHTWNFFDWDKQA